MIDAATLCARTVIAHKYANILRFDFLKSTKVGTGVAGVYYKLIIFTSSLYSLS